MKMLSSILVIGGTGLIGQHLVMASLNAGHPTTVLLRRASVADPDKARLVEAFRASGASFAYGDINDHEGLVTVIKQADVVISAVGHSSAEEVESQLKIVAAIQEAGNVRRFVPSEYGCDIEHAEQMLEPARSILGAKLRVREALKVAGIPYTIISSNWIQGFLLTRAGDIEADGPPQTGVTILGDGTTQAFFVNEKDLGTVVIKAMEDPRTLNKILHVRPEGNLCSLERLVSLWENKLGKTLEKSYVPEEVIVKKIQARKPKLHEMATTGISAGDGVEATELYPDMKYITVEQFLGSLPVMV